MVNSLSDLFHKGYLAYMLGESKNKGTQDLNNLIIDLESEGMMTNRVFGPGVCSISRSI